MKRYILVLAVACSLICSATSFASVVGVKLSLVIDNSGSISNSEYELMMDGYAAAFADSDVQALIGAQPNGIAVNVIFFGTNASTSIGWTHLTTAAEADVFSAALAALAQPTVGWTNIAAGMEMSRASLLDTTDFESDKLVMDVSGDGVQNVKLDGSDGGLSEALGIPIVENQRNLTEAAGIKVNGLTINTDFSDLDDYYTDHVITTDGFVNVANDFADFTDAVREKIFVELGGGEGGIIPEPTTFTVFASLLLIGAAGRWRRIA